MRKPNPYSPPRTLRQALWCLLHDSKLKVEALLAELLRVFRLKFSYSYLCNAVNPDLTDMHFQLRLLEPITRLTGNFVVLDYLEEQLGRVAVPIQVLDLHRGPEGTGHHALAETALVEVAKEMGDVAMAIQEGLCGDRRFSPDEAVRCRKELWELVQCAATLHHWMGPLTQDPEAVQELLAV